MVLEKTLNSPLDCKIKQSTLKEVNPECSLEGLMLKLKLQYFGHLMRRTDSQEKILKLGKIEGRRGRQRVRWLDGINGHEFEQAPGDGKGQGSLACRTPWGWKELDMTEQLNNNMPKHILLLSACWFDHIIFDHMYNLTLPLYFYSIYLICTTFFFFFLLCHAACGILASWPGIELVLLNH